MTQICSKKVEIKNEMSSPEERANRLRRARNLANLTRKDICDLTSININTYKGWEIAKYGGLPLDGAKKIIQCLTSKGVVCTLEWLLHGEALSPYVIPEKSETEANPLKVDEAGKNILHEIMLFQTQHPNSIYTKVTDDGLSPNFKKNDYVAGIRKYENELSDLLGKDCIVQLSDGSVIVRNIKSGNVKSGFVLICTNIDTTCDFPVLYKSEVTSAAEIIRLYRTTT